MSDLLFAMKYVPVWDAKLDYLFFQPQSKKDVCFQMFPDSTEIKFSTLRSVHSHGSPKRSINKHTHSTHEWKSGGKD